MKITKKILAMLLSFAMLGSLLAGCGSSKAKWEEFLDEYEDFVCEYIDIVKAFSDNPTDPELLSRYTDMVQKSTDMTDKAAEVKKEIENNKDASLKFTKRLLEIQTKMIDGITSKNTQKPLDESSPTPNATPTENPTEIPTEETERPIETPKPNDTPLYVDTPDITPTLIETPSLIDDVTVISEWQIALTPDNKYIKIENLDYSECVYEDGDFEGNIKFNLEITKDYIDKYREYDYVAQVYLGFYNEKGILVCDEVIEHDFNETDFDGFVKKYAKSCEVDIESQYPIKEVKILKIVCEKSVLVLTPDNKYIKVNSVDLSECQLKYGYFGGRVYFVTEVTQYFFEKCNGYYKFSNWEICLGFYDEKGMLVGQEALYDYCSENRAYVRERSDYVNIQTTSPIAEVKILKIECEQ